MNPALIDLLCRPVVAAIPSSRRGSLVLLALGSMVIELIAHGARGARADPWHA